MALAKRLFALFFVFNFSVAAAKAESWDMAMSYAADHYQSQTGIAFAECVPDKTAGELDVTAHLGGDLQAGSAIKEAVAAGETEIGERLISAEDTDNPIYAIASIPFLATYFDASEALWQSAQDAISAALLEKDLVYLYSVPWPPQGLYTNKPINSLSDLTGLTLRVYNETTLNLAEFAGMTPIRVDVSGLIQTAAAGGVDAFVASASTGLGRDAHQAFSHFYDAGAWLPRNVVFANRTAWEGLSPETQAGINECATQAAASGLTAAKKVHEDALRKLAENGMAVLEPSEALAAGFGSFGSTMLKKWLGRAGDQGKAVINAYNAR